MLLLPHNFGRTPIDYERFTIFAENNVPRFQVAVQHAAAMCVCHGVANSDKSSQ